jgi:hypothetical protein
MNNTHHRRPPSDLPRPRSDQDRTPGRRPVLHNSRSRKHPTEVSVVRFPSSAPKRALSLAAKLGILAHRCLRPWLTPRRSTPIVDSDRPPLHAPAPQQAAPGRVAISMTLCARHSARFTLVSSPAVAPGCALWCVRKHWRVSRCPVAGSSTTHSTTPQLSRGRLCAVVLGQCAVWSTGVPGAGQ